MAERNKVESASREIVWLVDPRLLVISNADSGEFMEEAIVLSKNNGGRPRRESSKYCVVHLQIIGLVYSGFEEARRQGEKFDAAIQAAIEKGSFMVSNNVYLGRSSEAHPG